MNNQREPGSTDAMRCNSGISMRYLQDHAYYQLTPRRQVKTLVSSSALNPQVQFCKTALADMIIFLTQNSAQFRLR